MKHATTDPVQLHRTGRLATVELCRPAVRNAIDRPMLAALEAIVAELASDDSVDVVVLTGSGEVFCAGTDRRELRPELGPSDMAGVLHMQKRAAELVERWFHLDQATLTVFNGPAIGAGAVLGLASDVRVAADTAYLQFPEVTLGVPLTWGGLPLLAQLVDPGLVRQWLLLGRRIPSDELLARGVVAAAVPLEQLGACAADVSATLGRLAPVARTMTKRMLRRAAPQFDEAAADGYLAALALLLGGGGSDQPHSGAIP